MAFCSVLLALRLATLRRAAAFPHWNGVKLPSAGAPKKSGPSMLQKLQVRLQVRLSPKKGSFGETKNEFAALTSSLLAQLLQTRARVFKSLQDVHNARPKRSWKPNSQSEDCVRPSCPGQVAFPNCLPYFSNFGGSPGQTPLIFCCLFVRFCVPTSQARAKHAILGPNQDIAFCGLPSISKTISAGRTFSFIQDESPRLATCV